MKTTHARRTGNGRQVLICSAAVVLVVVMLVGCEEAGTGGGSNDDTDDAGSVTYAVGDTGPAGGIVFYIDEAGDHDGWTYLEVWTADESNATIQWFDGSGSAPNVTTSTEIGSGYANTYDYMTGTEYPAAQAARDAGHGGETDWFLPSKDELKAVWENIVDDGNNDNSGTGDFWEQEYWSSSQVSTSSDDGWYQWFDDGNSTPQQSGSKTNPFYVRVIRRF